MHFFLRRMAKLTMTCKETNIVYKIKACLTRNYLQVRVAHLFECMKMSCTYVVRNCLEF